MFAGPVRMSDRRTVATDTPRIGREVRRVSESPGRRTVDTETPRNGKKVVRRASDKSR